MLPGPPGASGDEAVATDHYTLGVIVQNNYGGMADLQIDGVPVGAILKSNRGTAPAAAGIPESGKVAEGSK